MHNLNINPTIITPKSIKQNLKNSRKVVDICFEMNGDKNRSNY